MSGIFLSDTKPTNQSGVPADKDQLDLSMLLEIMIPLLHCSWCSWLHDSTTTVDLAGKLLARSLGDSMKANLLLR